MTTYSQQQVEAFASHAGFSSTAVVPNTGGMTQQEVIVGIAYAESHFQSPIIGDIGNPHGSSYGILQINTFWLSHGITIAGAQNPQQAFNFAFNTISHHGTSFTDWTTFNNGAYKQLKQTTAGTSKGIIHLPTNGWWHFSRIDGEGTNETDPTGHIFPKPDSNIIGLPANYPIATILSGTVTHTSSGADYWDGTVTIKLDSPINSLATHIAFLHLSQINTAQGKHVVPGDIIGHAGSRPLGSQNASLGVALYPGDVYGHGTEWAKMTKTNLQGPLNPVPIIEAAKNGTLSESGGGVSGGAAGSGTSPTNAIGQAVSVSLGNLFDIQINQQFLTDAMTKVKQNNPLSPDLSIAAVCIVLDQMMQYENPFNAFGSGNLLSDIGTFLQALFVIDFPSLLLRSFFLLFGIYIIFKVVNAYINITGVVGSVIQLAGTAAAFA